MIQRARKSRGVVGETTCYVACVGCHLDVVEKNSPRSPSGSRATSGPLLQFDPCCHQPPLRCFLQLATHSFLQRIRRVYRLLSDFVKAV